jgi:hypothetical protein
MNQSDFEFIGTCLHVHYSPIHGLGTKIKFIWLLMHRIYLLNYSGLEVPILNFVVAK